MEFDVLVWVWDSKREVYDINVIYTSKDYDSAKKKYDGVIKKLSKDMPQIALESDDGDEIERLFESYLLEGGEVITEKL